MGFGPFQEDLMTGARNAVGTCLAVQASEHVMLVADDASRAVAAGIAEALDEIGASWQGLLVEDQNPRPQTTMPTAISEALETADVGVLCIQPQPGELASRMAMVEIVERRQIRYAHMVGVNADIMRQGMRSDYRLPHPLCDRVRERPGAGGK